MRLAPRRASPRPPIARAREAPNGARPALRRRALRLAALLATLAGLSGCSWAARPAPIPPTPTDRAEAEGRCGRLQRDEGEGCRPLRPARVEREVVRLRSLPTPGGQIWLRGVVDRPVWEGQEAPSRGNPAVVLVHGSGPMSQEGWMDEDVAGCFAQPVPVLRELAEGLSARGYTVLRYDKRTCTALADPECAYPAEVARGATWRDLVGDLEAASIWLQAQPDVDAGDLTLAGYSQGATLALQASVSIKPRELVLLSATFGPIDEVIARQALWQLNAHAEAMPTDRLSRSMEQLELLHATLRDIRSGRLGDDRVFLNARVSFWRDWIAVTDQTRLMLEVWRGPLLVIAGGDDQNANDEDQGAWLGALQGRSEAEVVLLAGLSHALHRREGPGRVDEGVLAAMGRWLGRSPEEVSDVDRR